PAYALKASLLALFILFTAGSSAGHAKVSLQPVWLGDINHDGRNDLLFRRKSDGLLSPYMLNGFQVSPATPVTPIGPDFNLETMADFNGDGTADMLFRRPSDGKLVILLMGGGKPVAGQVIGAIGGDWDLIAAADFNGDGRADLLFRRTSD